MLLGWVFFMWIVFIVSVLVSMFGGRCVVYMWLMVVCIIDSIVLMCRFMCCGCDDFFSCIMVGFSGLNIVSVIDRLVVCIRVVILVLVLCKGERCCSVVNLRLRVNVLGKKLFCVLCVSMLIFCRFIRCGKVLVVGILVRWVRLFSGSG